MRAIKVDKEILFIFVVFFITSFGLWFLLYRVGINSLPLQSEDVIPSIFTGISIVENGTLDLKNYYAMMVSKYPHPDDVSLTPYYLRKVGESYLTAFPVMPVIFVLPVFYVYSYFVKNGNYSWEDIYLLSHLSGSLTVSIAGILMYFFLKNCLYFSKKISVLLSFIYIFGTINLPLISQALWQHGVVQVFTILGIIFLIRDKTMQNKNKIFIIDSRFFWAFLFFGLAFISRPTALLVPVIFSVYLIIYRSAFFNKNLYLNLFLGFLGFIIPVLFFLFYNSVYFKDFSNQGYVDQLTTSWHGKFPESFFGMWFSPSKGILIYSPVLFMGILGIWKYYRKNYLVQVCFWVILIHTLVMSLWKHWYGGFGYGYRMASDILPFFIIPMGILIKDNYEKYLKPLMLAFLISTIISFSGLVFYDSIWHNAYDRGYKDTGWLWSIENSEALFNIRRVMVKLGLLDKACEKCL